MPAGRPQKADPGALYAFAHQFYWDLKQLSEGYMRWKVDEEEYKQLTDGIEGQRIQLSDEQYHAIARVITTEVKAGRIPKSEEKDRLRSAAAGNREATRMMLYEDAADKARKPIQVPGKPDVIEALLTARTPDEVRTACGSAFGTRIIQTEAGPREIRVANWPISAGSVLPRYLSEYACEFIAAVRDPRFPKSTNRPSSRLKQLWFLSRALAGALYGVTTRTAINLVGSKRPEEIFYESRAGKPKRRRRAKR
ncbi:MAG TPA: hypothetical protein VFA85_17100 [Terriglobales bacterium]|nr:hypothetical protein [Terriglobales bacterium]